MLSSALTKKHSGKCIRLRSIHLFSRNHIMYFWNNVNYKTSKALHPASWWVSSHHVATRTKTQESSWTFQKVLHLKHRTSTTNLPRTTRVTLLRPCDSHEPGHSKYMSIVQAVHFVHMTQIIFLIILTTSPYLKQL